jgi:hypothetical protein
MRPRISRSSVLILASILFLPAMGWAQTAPRTNWIQATAYAIPKETAPQGEGYFALVEGRNGRLYVGTLNEGKGAYLVEFNPQRKRMKIVVDTHKAIGTDAEGFAAQSKIHTRCNVGASGRIYFATKQGHPSKGAQRTDYPGGYPMVYDPATGDATSGPEIP